MSSPRLNLRGPHTARLNPFYRLPLGQVLIEQGAITREVFLRASALAEQVEAPLCHVLLSEGWINDTQLLRAKADRFAAIPIQIAETHPDPACADLLDPMFCLEHGIWPWMRLGKTLVIATATPEAFEDIAARLPKTLGPILLGVATARDIETAIAQTHGRALAVQAEQDVPEDQSCRNMYVFASRRQMAVAAVVVGCIMLSTLLFPMGILIFLGLWSVLTLVALAGMKGIALALRLFARDVPQEPLREDIPQTPRVSLLVPLFHEADIAGSLIKRLSRLTYPKAKLEVLLILEAKDQQTRDTLAKTDLPAWMRVITVPAGALTTKPRALNYARRFATGTFIGIFDAEDAPAPDQIETMVAHFRRTPDEVACLQGVLDYYNPKMNWLARCFTIEYAAWFRVILPGLARAGFPIPLGGTTVFFRREILEELGGWDAHNVTEDADLGIRLARAGYRTELLRTITLEEANCRLWPWIKQRSRWLKGYTITYLVNMRRPAQLWRDLGARQFLGFQILFLASLSQFALAPLLWSGWVVAFGVYHPLVSPLSALWISVIGVCFFLSEVVALVTNVAAVASPRHRHLIPWVPTLLAYFPLAVIAIYKAFFETLVMPFYWDKTNHGLSEGHDTLDH